ncbi:cell envelope biogenesis protein TolA [Bradyrhizobium symbiodeficiens]|uniref:cell envelope biogenesis protein TolA n=1 Tax=Bradyrhizobium symbiodeficiens TaxID=1404367 RepID=UPI000BA19720|nr:cell envelope biogenesis protein TolA [Bradyrhizobium symbiodeficiens]AWM10300.1 cell envelope biogenesis protein TolA [Bradyrhizobium symbiodeficiens]QIP03391.1 cell envelope biogenesis protein TolA [Bradyrhizobium symbiodeficiens]
MARKLKTYQTSLGFFEQAIAAPSMKAALEAWGADSNLFHQGAAKESRDPDIIAATMAKPGVVLKRPVGSDGPFGENAELPKNLGEDGRKRAAPKSAGRKSAGGKAKKSSARSAKADDRKAAQAYERERQSRERAEAKEEAARQKERERRQRAVDKAQKTLDKAREEHTQRVAALRAEIERIETRLNAEDADWTEKHDRLKASLRRARD